MAHQPGQKSNSNFTSQLKMDSYEEALYLGYRAEGLAVW